MAASREFAKAVLVQVVALTLLFAGSPQPARSDPVVANVTLNQSFVAFRSCLPFTVLVQPPGNSTNATSSSVNGTVTVSADQSVIDAIWVTLDEGVLALSLWEDFETNHTINVTVIPGESDSLETVENLGAGDIVIARGLNSSSLSVSTYSVGSIYAYGVNTSHLTAASSGISSVSVWGSVNRADLTALGTSHTYLNSSNTSVQARVRTEGISSIVVAGGRGTRITGAADGLSKILFTRGICDVNSDTPFGVLGFIEPCQQIWNRPRTDQKVPAFSCGLRATGQAVCAGPANISLALNATNATNATVPPSVTTRPAISSSPSTTGVPSRTPQVTTPTTPGATANVTSPPSITNITAPSGTPGGGTAGNPVELTPPSAAATPNAPSGAVPTTPAVANPTPTVATPPPAAKTTPPAATPVVTPTPTAPPPMVVNPVVPGTIGTAPPPAAATPAVSPTVSTATGRGLSGRRLFDHHLRMRSGPDAPDPAAREDIIPGDSIDGFINIRLLPLGSQGLAVSSVECVDPPPEPLV